MKKTKGFTLVELIIVIAVIGVLAAILIPVFSNVIDKANAKSALSDARNTVSQIVIDSADNPNMPKNIVIAVKKAGCYYLYGYNAEEGGQLQVSTGNKFPKKYNTFEALFNDYSWNKTHSDAPDLTQEYDPTEKNQAFYLVKDGDGTGIKGFHGTKSVLDEYTNVTSLLETKLGKNDEIIAYKGILLPGGFTSASLDQGTGTHGQEQATVAPTANPSEEPSTEPSIEPSAEPSSDPEPTAPAGSYIIRTIKDFNNIPTTGMNNTYWLANDIDFEGTTVNPLGKTGKDTGNPFTGTFYGNGHTLSNFVLPTASYTGLFFENQGTITGLNVSNVNLTSAGSFGIIAYKNSASGKIEKCGSTGNITVPKSPNYFWGGGYWMTGGIVASNYGTIDQCWSNVNITAIDGNLGRYAGGIAGANYGTISNCFAFGKIEAPRSAGMAGYLEGTIENCYSMCKLNDTETSGTNTKHAWGYSEALTVKGFFYQRGLYYKNGVLKTTWDTETDPNGDYGCSLKTGEWVERKFTDNGWSTDIWDFSGAYPTLKNAPVADGISVQPPVTPSY